MPRARNPNATTRNPNRADLTRPSAVTTVPGQPYGEAAQQQVAQHTIPMGPQPVVGGQPPTTTSSGPSDMGAMMQALQAHAATHGGPQSLTRPTERPNEPVTAGLNAGPGPGPSSLQGVGAAMGSTAIDQSTLGHLLNSLTSAPGTTSAVVDLAQRLSSGAA